MSAPRVLVDLAALDALALHAPPAGDPERAALPTIGRLAREGALVLCTYPEFPAPAEAGAWRGTWRELLGEVPVTTIAPAMPRAWLGEDVFRGSAQPGALARLCTRLKNTDTAGSAADEPAAAAAAAAARVDPGAPVDPAAPADRATPAAAEAQGDPALPNPERYRRLAARVQGPHLADLFHLWSGELAGCAYWLVFDGALDAVLAERVIPYLDLPLRCEPVRPDRLLALLGIVERDARAIDPRTVVSIGARRARALATAPPRGES